jgi:putative flippase GtrA
MERLRSALRFRAVRFVTVGIGAAVLLFALSYLFVSFGMSPFLGSIAAYAVAFAVAYTAQHGWTFGGAHAHAHALPRYLAVQLGCALISGLVAHVSVESFGGTPFAMSSAVTVAASAASYILSSLWVFPRQADRG